MQSAMQTAMQSATQSVTRTVMQLVGQIAPATKASGSDNQINLQILTNPYAKPKHGNYYRYSNLVIDPMFCLSIDQ